jgi:YaiO family outer membrane protein
VNQYKLLRIIKWPMLILGMYGYSAEVIAAETIGPAKETRQIQQTRQIMRIKETQVAADLKYHNEMGFDFDKARISDLNTYWDAGDLFYYHINEYGKFGALVNRLKKFGTIAEQYQLDLNPKITDKIYANLSIAQSKKSQTNFPTTQYRVEGYWAAPYAMEFSLGHGGRMYQNFTGEKIYYYTASAGLYFGNYFVWVRPTHHTPQSLNFYEGGITRYFSDTHHYVRLSINSGKLPDIGDLPPLDALIIAQQEYGANLSGQFGMTTCFYLRWGLGYAKLVYPNNLHRYISDANIGLLWRF